ncbi:hypothetical protein AGLY_009568 [Aphis glycines]|uniref:Uncharacterized protein n=1 Tax=Aphis glycines TaxID=307491 RepID=A0A6G0TK21_APHGL|nr:hypothetical protein AGLY_009568 [Aphis glycines]
MKNNSERKRNYFLIYATLDSVLQINSFHQSFVCIYKKINKTILCIGIFFNKKLVIMIQVCNIYSLYGFNMFILRNIDCLRKPILYFVLHTKIACKKTFSAVVVIFENIIMIFNKNSLTAAIYDDIAAHERNFFFSKMITFRLLKYNYKFGNAVYKIMFEINNLQLFNLHAKIFLTTLHLIFTVYKEFSKE